MRSSRVSFFHLALASVLVSSVLPTLAHEEQVIVVGRNAAGKLVIDSDFDQPVGLPVSIFPGISGYATGELALHSTSFDDPTNDFFQLSTAADFRFILLAKDPGIEVWTGAGFMNTNDMYYVGSPPFDTHPIWNILNGTPGNSYSLTLKLRDLNGVYPDSEPFELSFSPVQPPIQIFIRHVATQRATLTWATNSVGWKLQCVSSLAGTDWSTVTNTPSIVGTNFSLEIDTVGSQQFFRLYLP